MAVSEAKIRAVADAIGTVTSLTASVSVDSATQYAAYTNVATAADITITLAAATPGKKFIVLKESRYYKLYVDCQFGDLIEGQPNGLDLALVDNGFVVLECLKSGCWSITSGRGLRHPRYYDNHRQLYLATTGSDSNNGTAVGTPKLTVKGIAAIARPGDVVNVAAGNYTGADNYFTESTIPMGTKHDRIKFVCATAFGARFEQFVVSFPSYRYAEGYEFWCDFENIVWRSSTNKSIRGRQMRFFRCAFIDGVTTAGSNSHVVSIGSSDSYAWDTSDILLEDCVALGVGGRYRALVYGAKNVILRRCVGRWDQGWDDNGSGTQAADFGLYDASNCELQNCLSFDDLAPATYPGVYKGAFFLEQNYYAAENLALRGCIVVNNQGPAIAINGLTVNPVTVPSGNTAAGGTPPWNANRKMRAKNWLIQDFAAAKVLHPSAYNVNAIDVGLGPFTLENFTIADLNRAAAAGKMLGYSVANPRWMDGSRIANGVTVYGATGGAAHIQTCVGVTEINNATYANLAAAETDGLFHLPMADYGDVIQTNGRGAEILKRIGAPGSMYGEPGYRRVGDGTTASDLWPWPYEDDIKALFVEFGGSARGWIAGSDTLTEYVWGILGTAGPP